MRVFLICLLAAALCAGSARAGDNSWNAPLPRLPEFKPYKPEIPGGKQPEKLDIPPVDETPYTDDPGEYGQKKFGAWWFSNSYPGDRCHLQQVAEGWQTFLLAFEPHVTFNVATKLPDLLSLYVPSQPHPKGIPVAFVDQRSFTLSPQKAKTFVLPKPRAQKDMLQAMKAGKVLVVKWIDGDGARREDRYPLTGFSEAFAELSRRGCPSSG